MGRNNKKLTTEEWVSKCKEIHGETFNYDKSNYINSSTPIVITCKVHGDISVNPTRHKSGAGCRYCKKEIVATKMRGKLEDYILKFKEVHGDKYDYSNLVQFKRNTDKGVIICPKHGEFKQSLRRHAEGLGCEKCSYEERGNARKITYETIVSKSLDKFGEKYSYCEESFKKDSNNLLITCPIHGTYYQKRGAHFNSPTGCNKCSGKLVKHTTETFINKAKEVHKDFYDYSKTEYKNNNTEKVVITCKHHGDFNQTPVGHLGGAGCPICANIKSNILWDGVSDFIDISENIEAFLYLVVFDKFCKIGITTNPHKRFLKLKKIFGEIKEEMLIKSTLYDVAIKERDLLKKYNEHNCKDIFPYNVEGRTECFNLNVLENLKTHFQGYTECFTP